MLWLFLLAQSASTIPAFDGQPTPDPVLAEQRGGLRLPNGIDVALTVQTRTALDGAIVLETTWKVDQGRPETAVYVPRPGEKVESPANQGGAPAMAYPSVSYDRSNGLTITGNRTITPVNIGTAQPGGATTPTPGLQAVDLSQPVQTDAGSVSRSQFGRTDSIDLNGADLVVRHLNGSALGSVIENAGSDRIIDTQTTLSIDLRNAGPDVLGSSFLRVEAIAIDALTTRLGS